MLEKKTEQVKKEKGGFSQKKTLPFVRFNITVHGHQPVGNLPSVFEEAYETCYGPFLQAMARHPSIRFSYHISGPLLEWLEKERPEHLDMLAELVERGQTELLLGPFYEPIVTAIPKRDALEQISLMREYLKTRFNFEACGMWLPERVWEAHLPALLKQAGVEFTLVDDTHFLSGGVPAEELHGYFLSEEAGEFIALFPLLESLRYAIPFKEPSATVSILKELAEKSPGTVVVYGDDVEKFGVWPGTYKRCYQENWLEGFLSVLEEHSLWIETVFLKDALKLTEPRGVVYPPDVSYTEMNEWTVPHWAASSYRLLRRKASEDPQLKPALPFVRGPSWRSFRRKYPEIRRLYGRALWISKRVAALPRDDKGKEARIELYRGQCNCPYWHGIFGGHYLPHLREAVWRHLLTAEKISDQILPDAPHGGMCAVSEDDIDLDGKKEVFLRNENLATVISRKGATAIELDLRPWAINLFSVLSRRPESYHAQVKEALERSEGNAALKESEGTRSIHDLVLVKDSSVREALAYDRYEHLGFVDLFFCEVPPPEAFLNGEVEDTLRLYERNWQLSFDQTEGKVLCKIQEDLPVSLCKEYQLFGAELRVRYRALNLSSDPIKGFLVTEFPVALQTGDSPNRIWCDSKGKALGSLGRILKGLKEGVGVVDWDHALAFNLLCKEAVFFTYPVKTVSQSESGFEAIFQQAVACATLELSLQPGEERSWEVSFEARKAPVRSEVLIEAEKIDP